MIHPIRNAPTFSLRTAVHSVAFALFGLACLHSPASRADDFGDELAMPGLWKHDVSVVHHGQQGKPTTRWHCLLDDDDPWKEFASHLTVPGQKCKPTNEHRDPKALTWTLVCPGHASATAHLTFDSNEHYTGSILSKDNREIVHVEGQHRAACTDPSD